jgi:hypothetical protein
MSLIHVIVVLIVVGVVLWLINTYIPMDAKIKGILNAVIVIAVILWLLQGFGVLGSLSGVHVR